MGPSQPGQAEVGLAGDDDKLDESTLTLRAAGTFDRHICGFPGPRAAVLYTILAGAKRHRIEPWAYVRELLMRLNADDQRLEDLLPDRWAIQHPESMLTYRLEESRNKAAIKRDRRTRRRAQAECH